MATAKVTLTVSPSELQVMNAALRMYAHVHRNASREDRKGTEGYQFDLFFDDHRKHAIAAEEIRMKIGLK